jgi:sodium-dependent dicarboxylate transporter 2/3/5
MVAVAFAIVSACFTSNTGSAALLIPIFYAVAKELGLGASSLIIPIALASSCSFMLPISTPPNAIVYGTGMVTQNAMLKNGFLLSVLCFFFISLCAYFLI